MYILLFKDPKRLTPTVVVRGATVDDVFDADTIQVETVTDGVVVSQPKDVFHALSSVLAMYWVFDIAYADRLRKTLVFLASHVCKLESVKPNVAIQRRLNVLYAL